MDDVAGQLTNLTEGSNLSLLLAARIVRAIEDSGAAQTEVIAALGIVQCLLPTLKISSITDEDACASGHPGS
jgi:hypothetical protein